MSYQEEEESQEIPYLTYGSIISVSHSSNDSAYIYSDGHVKDSVMLKNFEALRRSGNSSGLKNDNFSSCLFQIFPRVSNNTKGEIIKKFDQLRSSEEQGGQAKTTDAKRKEMESKQSIGELQTKLLNEYKYNYDTFQKQKGTKVSYNNVVQLLHVNSSKFLACHPVESQYEKENYRIQLDEYTSENTLFQITSAFKYQKDGDQIIYANEVINIVRASALHNQITSLHASGEISELKKQPSSKLNKAIKNFTDTKSQSLPSGEEGKGGGPAGMAEIQKLTGQNKNQIFQRQVNASLEEPTNWKVNLFSDVPKDGVKFLNYGDVIWLHHSQANASLAATRITKGTDKYNFTSLNMNTWLSQENLEISVITAKMTDSFEEYSGNTFGMWVVENQDFSKGGPVMSDHEYRLRHLSSGYYLSVGKHMDASQGKQSGLKSKSNISNYNLQLISTASERSTLFEFSPLKTSSTDNDRLIRAGSFIFIKNKESNQWVDVISMNEENLGTSLCQAVMKNDKAENQVFQLYLANSGEVWQISFVISCFRLLVKFIIFMKENQVSLEEFEDHLVSVLKQKIRRATNCIKNLNLFCNNKLYNTDMDQKYGTINVSRQKLLREQYYIDILIKILEDSLPKRDLDLLDREREFLPIEQEVKENEINSFSPPKRTGKQKNQAIEEYIELVRMKKGLCIEIYTLVSSITQFNFENEMAAFQLIPFFQIHCQYIEQSIECIIEICQNNETLLTRLSEGLQIDYEYGSNASAIEDENKLIQFQINLYDEEVDKQSREKSDGMEEKIEFRQAEKITSKAINLITYFMRLIWDKQAKLRPYYLRFLRSIASFGSKGMSLNQENIYKIFKNYNSIRPVIKFDQYFKSGMLKLPADDKNEEVHLKNVEEQLLFYAAMAFGRNYLWRKELIPHFSNHYLLENIWSQGLLKDKPVLRSCFCKLAMSLYIDHDPLDQKPMPAFCKLYQTADFKLDLAVFQSEKNQDNEISMYTHLLEAVEQYYEKTGAEIKFNIEQFMPQQNDSQQNKKNAGDLQPQNLDILQDILLLNSSDMLYLLIQLSVFTSFYQTDMYQVVLQNLLRILVYDKYHLAFVCACLKTEEENVDNRRKDRDESSLGIDLSFHIDLAGNKKKDDQMGDDENDMGKFEMAKVDDNQLFLNPIMRGFIRLNNELGALTYQDSKEIHIEIQIKLKACEIVERFLDERQEFLMNNILYWFKKKVVEAENQGIQFNVKLYLKAILPNIALTGFKDVDKEYSLKSSGASLLKGFGNLMTQTAKWTQFTNFLQDINEVEIPDLDTLLYRSNPKEDPEQTPIAAVLPYLLNSFLLVHNPELEQRILSLMMRLFNQRSELISNLQQMQVLFDDDQTNLYYFLKDQVKEFTHYIEQSEVWFTTFAQSKGRDGERHQMQRILQLLLNLKNGVFKEVQYLNNNRTIRIDETKKKNIDQDQQIIYKYLNVYQPVISLIKDGMYHFHQLILQDQFDEGRKAIMIEVFTCSFELLRNFVYENEENQMIVFKYMHLFTNYLKYDLGQVQLICEIFRDNSQLLTHHVNKRLIDQFIHLIDNEGRQEHVLNFFIVIQKRKTQYLFDNQLLVLNTLLLMQDISERELKLIYADNSQKRDIRFHFDNITTLKKLSLLEKLKEVDFHDTLRDEPFLYHKKLLSVLLETAQITVRKKDGIQDELMVANESFNISIAKLKKTFSLTYLVEVLIGEEDDFSLGASGNIAANSLKKSTGTSLGKQLSPLKGSGTPNLSKGKLNELISPSQEDSADSRNIRRKGFSMLKPKIVEFMRIVHVVSQKQNSQSAEYATIQKEMAQLIESEQKRLISIVTNDISPDYVQYLFTGLVPLFYCYKEKFLSNSLAHMVTDEDERRDDKALESFVKTLGDKINQMKREVITEKQFERSIQLIKQYKEQCDVEAKEFEFRPAHEDDESDDPYDLQGKGAKKGKKSGWEGFKMINVSKQPKEEPQQPQHQELKEIDIEEDNKMGEVEQLNAKHKSKETIKPFEIERSAEKKQTRTPGADSPTKKYTSTGFLGLGQRKLIVEKLYEVTDTKKIEEAWHELVGFLGSSKQVQEELEQEKSAIADAIMQINTLIQQEYLKLIEPQPDSHRILKKFISFLQTAIEDSNNQLTIITLLNIMRRIIEKTVEDQKEEVQNQFDSLGATQMVLLVLSENNQNLDMDLIEQFLRFINTLLEGGNHRVQVTIYEFFCNYSKSEVLFQKFNSIIRQQMDQIELLAKETQDNHLAQEDIDPDLQSTPQEIQVLEYVLTFLQNCVEGHYLDLQNYFRHQTNSRNNYDMINAVADLLRAYYYESRTKQMYDNMIKCMDTLSEFVQGPCPENQIAVSESKFLEIANDLFETKTKKQQKQDTQTEANQSISSASQIGEKFKSGVQKIEILNQINRGPSKKEDESLDNWMIARLQMKCLILVLSLLEMRDVRENNSIIKRIMRTLPIHVLQRHLHKIYSKFRDIYEDDYRLECLQHVAEDPRELEAEKIKELNPLYFETIIQNGFYIFFLISSYIESDNNLEGQIIQYHRQYQKRILKEQVGGLEGLILGDNIIGQIASFVYSIIKQGLNYAEKVKQMTIDKLQKEKSDDPETKARLAREKAELKKQILKKAFNFFQDNTAHIEVVRNDKLELIYYILLPYAHCLPKQKKVEFNEKVDRSNVKSKVSDLVDASQDLIEVCKHELKLKQFFAKNQFLALFANYVKLWKDIAFLFTLILNLFILLSYSNQYGDRMKNVHLFESDSYSKDETEQIFFILGLIMTCCSLFVVAFFLVKNLPLIIQKSWADQDPEEAAQYGFFQQLFMVFFQFFKVLIALLQEIQVIYYLAYGTLAILGIVIHHFFFTFHLTEILIRYPTLKNVIRSVYEPRQQLGLTLVLFIILQYIFSILAYSFFSEDYQGNCQSMLYCFFFTFDYTFKANGGVGGWLTDINNQSNVMEYSWGRFFFDNMSNIILVIIMVNIVAGIIIDTFGSLREAEGDKNRDIEDKCFICGNLKTTFDRQSDTQSGFQSHIKINHYMWNYVFFIAYIDWKEQNDYTGIQSFIRAKLDENDSSWFPFNQARELSDLNEDENQKERQQIQILHEDIKTAIGNIKEIDQILSDAAKAQAMK